MIPIPDSELNSKEFRVTIFGSARIKEEDPIYKDVYNLAYKVGQLGVDMVTGGGPGLMQAASSGHNAGKVGDKAQTIGLNIILPFEQKPNLALDMLENHERFSTRLDEFMLLSSIVVVTPGGIGTCLELFFTWQLLQVKHHSKMPIILVGEMWKEMLEWVKEWPLKLGYMNEEDLHYIFVVNSCDEAFEIINTTKMGFDIANKPANIEQSK